MDIHVEKIELAKLLLNTNNPSIIQAIKTIFKKSEMNDFWDTLSNTQQKEIQEASQEIKNGQVSDYDKFIAKHQ